MLHHNQYLDTAGKLGRNIRAGSRWKPRLLWASDQRCFFGADDRLVGFVPNTIEEGDIIVVLRGWSVPYALRPQPSGSYTLVGECYIHGIMHGEMLNGMDRKEEVFNIE
jgi:hypothetical protein